MEYTDKKEKARNFVAEHLKEDIIDPKNLPLRETALNWAISILRLAVTAVNVVYSTVQLIFSLWLAAGDLIARGLNKAMPAPRLTEGEVQRLVQKKETNRLIQQEIKATK